MQRSLFAWLPTPSVTQAPLFVNEQYCAPETIDHMLVLCNARRDDAGAAQAVSNGKRVHALLVAALNMLPRLGLVRMS